MSMSDTQEVKYSAGIVTAYGAAVKGGYTGTYEEFCAEQAGFAGNAQQVAEDRAAVEALVPDVTAALEEAEAEITQAVTNAKSEMDTKAAQTIASIPADYTSLSNEVDDLKSDLSDTDELLHDVSDSIGIVKTSAIGDYQVDSYWNIETGTAVLTEFSGYCAFNAIPVTSGQQYIIKVYEQASNKQKPVVLVDANYAVIKSYSSSVGQINEYNFVVPTGCAYVLLTTANSRITRTECDLITLNDLSNVADDMLRITTGFTNIETAIGQEENELIGTYTFQYWNSEGNSAVLTPISASYVAFSAIEVTPGKTYHIKAYKGTSSKQNVLLMVDENMLIIQRYGDRSAGYIDEDVTAPAGSKYALITVGTRSTSYIDQTSFSVYEYTNIAELKNSVSKLLNGIQIDSFKGKKVAIIGDSISTNGDLGSGEYPNIPEITISEEDVGVQLSAYLTYYDVQGGLSLGNHTFTDAEIGTEVTFTAVSDDIGKSIGKPLNHNPASRVVWWEVAMEALGFTPIPVCWSGSSITSHEGDKNTYKTSYAWHDAQIRKCGIRTPGTMERSAPDIIIIYRGTNDFSHSPYVKLTENYFGSENWTYPITDQLENGYGLKEGLSLLISKLRSVYPTAIIYLATLNVFKRVIYDSFPTRNGFGTLPEYNEAIREVARYMGCNVISFDKDGITFENCYSGGYITDSATTPTHPNDKGHAVMGRQAIHDLVNTYTNV